MRRGEVEGKEGGEGRREGGQLVLVGSRYTEIWWGMRLRGVVSCRVVSCHG